MRSIIVILVLTTLYLQYFLWFGHGGIRDVNRLEESVLEQRDQLIRLGERNRALAIEVMDLKQGLEAIEERARIEMGMIKQGEFFYQVVDRLEAGSRLETVAPPAVEGE